MFIVTGRTGHSLVIAKALPFAILEQVKSIYIFSESEGFAIPQCKYITLPLWIRNTKPAILGKTIRFIFEPIQLLYYSIKIQPDFINGVYCLPKGLNSYIVSRLTGVKCVNSIIGSILEVETELPFRSFWRRINLWHLKGCEGITIKGEKDRQYLIANGIDPDKIFLFNGAIDTERFSFANSKRTIDLLYVGSFIELKRVLTIIVIVKRLLKYFPHLKVVMAGNGFLLEEARLLSEDLGVINNITFAGFQKGTVPLFQQSRILVMPSRSEGLPTSMLEAMSCGCVPVISNVGNIGEAAVNNFNAKLIDDYSDTDAFVDAITEMLNDEIKRNEFARNGRETVEKYYSVVSQSKLAGNLINYLYH